MKIPAIFIGAFVVLCLGVMIILKTNNTIKKPLNNSTRATNNVSNNVPKHLMIISNIEGRQSIARYDVDTVNYDSNFIHVFCEDGREVIATQFLIDGEDIYIKY